jgi:type 1 glutamine amidotransferase
MSSLWKLNAAKACIAGVTLTSLVNVSYGQAPANTKLKSILLLDKSAFGANGHKESRVDLIAALQKMGTEKGFTVDIIGQNDNTVNTKFTDANLAKHQVVLFSNNDGVDDQITGNARVSFEKYVNEGGGFMPIHAASAFCDGWSWFDQALVQKFYGPHGSNQPSVDVVHDVDGIKEGTETAGIFKGLTAPLQFLDEYYAFRSSPRSTNGVTVLVNIKESSANKALEGAMGNDHPVIWAKTMGKGRVVHNSMGHSWSHNNVYTAKSEYFSKLMYGMLRYAAGDFIGCMDNKDMNYNPDATKNDATACQGVGLSRVTINNSDSRNFKLAQVQKNGSLGIEITASGNHNVGIYDMSGKAVQTLNGMGPKAYSLSTPKKSGFYMVKVNSNGNVHTQKITVL